MKGSRLSLEDKEAIGQAIIDRIRDRTSDGIDASGKEFKKYSPDYIKSDNFKAFGKNKGKVNLKLTGDMLGLMDIVKIEGNKLTIGWSDSDEAAKAHGHITGANGNLPVRDFFNIKPADIKEVINDEN